MMRVAVSGGMDPLHPGHIKNMVEASKMGKVEVYLASDGWLRRKKGYRLMQYELRKEIIESYDFVDRVLPQLEDPTDSSVTSLMKYRPDIFAKGGDRTEDNMPEYELMVCKKLGIEIKYGVGGFEKYASSSELFGNALEEYLKSKNLLLIPDYTLQGR